MKTRLILYIHVLTWFAMSALVFWTISVKNRSTFSGVTDFIPHLIISWQARPNLLTSLLRVLRILKRLLTFTMSRACPVQWLEHLTQPVLVKQGSSTEPFRILFLILNGKHPLTHWLQLGELKKLESSWIRTCKILCSFSHKSQLMRPSVHSVSLRNPHRN